MGGDVSAGAWAAGARGHPGLGGAGGASGGQEGRLLRAMATGRCAWHRDTPEREHARVLAYVLAAARADAAQLMPAAARGAEDALQAAEQRAAQAGEAGARVASEQELAAASKAMLRMARRLAAAARPIANTNARWRQARRVGSTGVVWRTEGAGGGAGGAGSAASARAGRGGRRPGPAGVE